MEMTIVEDDESSNDIPPTRCQLEGCTNSVTKPARGRSPKFCDEHRNTKTSSTGKSRTTVWANANAVEKALSGYLNSLGVVVSFVNANDGMVIAKGADNVAHEITELGRADKKLRHKLELLAAPGKYGPLILAVMPIVIPIMANHGLIPQFVIGEVTGEEES